MFTALLVATLINQAAPAPEAPKYPPYVTAKTLYAQNDLRGKAAPKFEVESWLTAAPKTMKDKVILVDFWATWCGPCRQLIPEMNEWKTKFKDDLVIVGVSDEPTATLTKFMKDTKMDYFVATDPQKRMSKVLGVQGIPHVMVISADGIVRWQGFPPMAEDKLDEAKLAQIIAASKAKVK